MNVGMFFLKVQIGTGARPVFYSVLTRLSSWGVWLATNIHLTSSIRMTGAIPPVHMPPCHLQGYCPYFNTLDVSGKWEDLDRPAIIFIFKAEMHFLCEVG